MNNRANVWKVATSGLCVACVAWLMCVGCVSRPARVRQETPRVIVADGGEVVTAAELDELTRAFADRYVGLLYSACEAVKQGNPDPVQRLAAQELLLDGASNIYDIASNADAFTRLLDMVVVTSLMTQVWVDDGRAERVFGDRAQPLLHALVHSRTEARDLAARVLTAEQLQVLESLLADWWKQNPEMVHVSFVRFSNFAIGRGRSSASEVLAARGFFSEVGQAGQAVDEARLLGERVFYQLKRQPTLLRWQLMTVKDELLATPEVASALTDLNRLTTQVEQLPAHVAAEREAIAAAVDSSLAGADKSIANVKEVIAETKSLVTSLEQAGESLHPLLGTADALFARFDEWDRWADTNRSRLFDVREYTELVTQTGTTAQGLDELLKSWSSVLASPDWRARIDEWNRAADGRIEIVAAQSRLLVSDLFRRVYISLGALFIVLVCYRLISILLTRRLATHGAKA